MSKRTSRTFAAAVASAAAAALIAVSASAAAADPDPGAISVGSAPTEPGTYSVELQAANSNGDSVSFVIVGDLTRDENIRTHLQLWKADWSTEALALLPGDAGGHASGINNALTVVGTSLAKAGGQQHAVRWTSPSTPTELPPLPGDTVASPAAIADNGTAVGSSWGAAAEKHAVAWPPSGAPVALPPLPGDTASEAVAVNGSGTAVGYSYPAGDPAARRAVAWSPGGTVTAFDVPAGSTSSGATRITDSGVVIGAGVVIGTGGTGVGHALVWNAAGAVADLGAGSEAKAVNNAGTVVGGLNGQAARWAVDGTPSPLTPTTLASVATGINDQGVIVGYTSDPWPARAQLYAQRWNPDGSVLALPAWSVHFPYAMPSFITDSGIVLGELLLRGPAGYGRPLTIRWTM
ncbi:hypothetical protein [Kitasatospora sp. NPDC059327]|uniref:hypothetical protein n=1 Tax=Kitasatospora sp. NPDC059327 TaxID=3346803 RepID=UPI0036BF74DF